MSSRGTGPASGRVAGGAGPAARGAAKPPLVVAIPEVDAAVAGDLRVGVRQGLLNDDHAGGRVEGCHDAGSLVVCFPRGLGDAATRCAVRPVAPSAPSSWPIRRWSPSARAHHRGRPALMVAWVNRCFRKPRAIGAESPLVAGLDSEHVNREPERRWCASPQHLRGLRTA